MVPQNVSRPISPARLNRLRNVWIDPPSNMTISSELIRRAEDIDADAIIGLDYETDGIVPVEETGVQLKRILATGVAVKLSCAA